MCVLYSAVPLPADVGAIACLWVALLERVHRRSGAGIPSVPNSFGFRAGRVEGNYAVAAESRRPGKLPPVPSGGCRCG